MNRLGIPLLAILSHSGMLLGQKPVIYPGGAVNAASYATGGPTGRAISTGIVSIFGENLAPREESANSFPLPRALAGVSVTVSGIIVPLLFVSPKQINLQMPTMGQALTTSVIVVTTPSGSSDPFPYEGHEVFGIFTQDQSGCGPGAVLNVVSNGATSLNTQSNSVSPGDYISIFGTGLLETVIVNRPPDGSPAPLSPLTLYQSGMSIRFDRAARGSAASWAGLAPGWVSLNQINVRIPETVREGCAVPLNVGTSGDSPPVTISIRKGGGQCQDPPIASYGQITWDKTTATGTVTDGTSETVMAIFSASPGKSLPNQLGEGCVYNSLDRFGPSCPIPGYRNLDAGAMRLSVPGLPEIEAVPAIVDGQEVYRAELPEGTVQPGSFRAGTTGGEIGSFESGLQIGTPIQLTSSFPPGTFINGFTGEPFVVNWTGGDPDAFVTIKLMNVTNRRILIQYSTCRARASAGRIVFPNAGLGYGISPGGEIELLVEVTPDPSKAATISAPGLTLGGEHTWKYTYRFGGLRMQ